MERIEGSQSRPVHVLRHRFEPSEKLTAEVRKFLKPETPIEKFRFFGTKIAILDGANFYSSRYTEEVNAVAENFEKSTTPVHLSGRVGFREVGNNTRISLQPLKQLTFNAFVSDLDKHLPTLRPDGYSLFNPEGRHVNHYIYTEVPKSLVVEDHEELVNIVRAFRATVLPAATQLLFALRPLEIVGQDHTITYGEKEEAIAAAGRKVDPWIQDGLAS